ncbi:MAG TPA: Hsp33 family molecular chaperone HslO [Thermoanaerobaculia bacterium]|nr:Hsp33 family molecular chaperone HslO [Thermoanaerobaculia bacterium]
MTTPGTLERLERVSAEGALEMGLAGGGWLRYGVADLGEVVEEARGRLDLSPIAAAALGRSMAAAALLLRLAEKTPSRLVLEVRGSGPLRSVLAEADEAGHLRGTVGNPRVDLPHGAGGQLAVGAAVGAGILRVVRELPGGSYASQVELVSGEIGLDVAHFLRQSEQTRSAVLLGVLTRPEGVAGAGGLIVELLPGAPEEVVSALEGNLAGVAGVSRLLEEGGREQVLEAVLAGLDREAVERRPLLHRCRCSRERLGRHLTAVPDEDVAELLTEEGRVEADCVFCGARYVFHPDELRAPDA